MRLSHDAPLILALTLTVLVIGLTIFGLAKREATSEPDLIRATVVHVDDSLEWQTPRTLLEYENGQRGVITGYYGEVGDTFLIQRPRR